MTRDQVQNQLAEITVGIPNVYRGKVEKLIRELFHFAQDAARGRDEAVAANRALEELMGERQQQVPACKLEIKQLEANLEKAKRETQVMRDKLDEWCQALSRAEKMTERFKRLEGSP